MAAPVPSIIVTGAAGFVGRHLLAALRQRLPEARLHTEPFDVTDAGAVRATFAALRPTHCVHLAAIAAIGEARAAPERAWRVNVDGTLLLARTIAAVAPDCALLFVSSADAYGASFRVRARVDEDSPLAPLNTYGATKAAADLALGAMAAETGLRAIRLRAFNHTGPGQRDDFVVPAFARQIAEAEAGRAPPVLRVGALDPERDFLDVRDVVRAYAEAVARSDAIASGTVLNVASGRARRVREVLDGLLALARVRMAVEPDPARMRPSDIPRAVGDPRRAEAVLGWSPAIAWDTTLADVLDDWRRRAGT